MMVHARGRRIIKSYTSFFPSPSFLHYFIWIVYVYHGAFVILARWIKCDWQINNFLFSSNYITLKNNPNDNLITRLSCFWRFPYLHLHSIWQTAIPSTHVSICYYIICSGYCDYSSFYVISWDMMGRMICLELCLVLTYEVLTGDPLLIDVYLTADKENPVLCGHCVYVLSKCLYG